VCSCLSSYKCLGHIQWLCFTNEYLHDTGLEDFSATTNIVHINVWIFWRFEVIYDFDHRVWICMFIMVIVHFNLV